MPSANLLARRLEGNVRRAAPVRATDAVPSQPIYSDKLAETLATPTFGRAETSAAAIARALTPALGVYMQSANRKQRGDLETAQTADTDADLNDLAAALGRRGRPEQQLAGDETGTTTQPYQRGTPGGMDMGDVAGMRTEAGRNLGISRFDKQEATRTAEANTARVAANRTQDRAWQVEDRDLALEEKRFEAKIKAAAEGGDPAAVREYQFWAKLPEESRRDYLLVKRANAPMNLGDIFGERDPLNPGQLLGQYGVGVKPGVDVNPNGNITTTGAVAGSVRPNAQAATEGAPEAVRTPVQAPEVVTQRNAPTAEQEAKATIAASERDRGRRAAEAAVTVIDEIANDPELPNVLGRLDQFKAADGMGAMLASQKQIDLLSRIENARARTFAAAYETLKGGGQITEYEGQTAANAISNLSRAQSPESFKGWLKVLKDAITSGTTKLDAAAAAAAIPLRGAAEKPREAPPGVPADVWGAMTPAERALWQN